MAPSPAPAPASAALPTPTVTARRDGNDTAVKSADRVLTVLDLLAARGPSTFSAIVSALGLPNSSAHNLLQTMVRRDYLEFDPETRTYALGLRLWQVAQAYGGNRDLVEIARPLMQQVVDITGETVQLARLDGVENVYLAIAESPHPMKLVSTVGARLYAHATGLGKALLAGLPDDEVRRRLDGVVLPAFTPHTITDADALVAAVREVRARGFATDDEEYVIGCRCVAMGIHDVGGSVVAAMSVSIPTPRHTPAIERRARTALAEAVAELERGLGYVAASAASGAGTGRSTAGA
ncbi:MAG: IclR family transcriptional regulator [Chloroflexota bacterium]